MTKKGSAENPFVKNSIDLNLIKYINNVLYEKLLNIYAKVCQALLFDHAESTDEYRPLVLMTFLRRVTMNL